MKIKTKKSDAGKRADVFIAEKLPEFTRSSLSGLFEKGLVLVNSLETKAGHKLKDGDKLEVDTNLLTARPATIKLPIIYEDEDIIVINKPAGVLTHSKGALNTEATVASWLLQHLSKDNYNIKSSFPGWHPGDNRLGIVHRLDRTTSGVIIVAKNDKTLKWLQTQFSTRKVRKVYHAIVEGIPDPDQAIIDVPIERNPKKPQTFRVSPKGKPAQTRYKVIKNFINNKKIYSLLELNPQTGRTHQLRVHLKYIGHPIVGDSVYGHGGSPTKISTKFQAGENMYLHAKSLEVTLPGGLKKIFEVAEPEIFKDFR